MTLRDCWYCKGDWHTEGQNHFNNGRLWVTFFIFCNNSKYLLQKSPRFYDMLDRSSCSNTSLNLMSLVYLFHMYLSFVYFGYRTCFSSDTSINEISIFWWTLSCSMCLFSNLMLLYVKLNIFLLITKRRRMIYMWIDEWNYVLQIFNSQFALIKGENDINPLRNDA